MGRRGLRTIQIGSLTLASLCLAGYFSITYSDPELARVKLLTPTGEAPSFSMLIAGLDVAYCAYHTPCKADDPRIQALSHTDTIMLLNFNKTNVTLISIPRDTQVEDEFRKINSSYTIGGAELLKTDVEDLIGRRIDYYGVVKLSYVAQIIDALGGLDVIAPADVDFHDNAANLHLTLEKGPHHLNGADAVAFLRMRKAIGWGDDYGRIDRQKAAVNQLLEKLRKPSGLGAVPVLVGGFGQGIESDADPAMIQSLVPYLGEYRLNMATLPTEEVAGSTNLLVKKDDLPQVLGEETADPSDTTHPAAPARIVDASGGQLGEAFARYLKLQGFNISGVLTIDPTPEPSQVLTLDQIADAERYAHFLKLTRFQALRYPIAPGEVVLHLGPDAKTRFAALKDLE